jgi:surface carbohydrate biosynthesis protein
MDKRKPLAPIVYLTAELKSRDLDSRFLIAAHLLKMGFAVVVGQQWAIGGNASNAPLGCYFFKTMNIFQSRLMARVRDIGHLVIAADEEALCCSGYLSLDMVHPDAMAAVDAFLAQNEAHRNTLAKAYPGTKISIVGSARVDLLTMAKARGVRPLAEPYILFNTNFPLTNGFTSLDVAASVVKDLNADIEYEIARREHLVALLRWCVDNIKSHRIVIRPHPGERFEPWQELFANRPNVLVVGRSDPVQWIYGADVTIISDSTTGLEAMLMDKACLNIAPAGFEDRSGERILRHINFSVSHAAEAIEPLMDFLTKKRGPLATWKKTLQFPKDGARRTAQVVAKEFEKRGTWLPAPMPHINWRPAERTEEQRQKFSLSENEARERAAPVFGYAGLKAWDIKELDDSVFLIAGR